MNSLRFRYLTGPLVLAAMLVSGPASAADNVWDGEASLNYNIDDNWDNAVGGTAGLVPDGAFDEVAIINNGDAVFLSTTPIANPAGLQLSNTSSLEIQSGGNLGLFPGGLTPESFPGNADINAGATLTVRRGGTLSASGALTAAGALDLGEIGGSGTAMLSVTGNANLSGTTDVTGPNVSFTAGSFSLGGGHTLAANITNATTHSPLTTTGSASLGGALELTFDGVSPSVGNSWTLVDAGSIQGGFAGVTAPALGRGEAIIVSTTGGGNGAQLVATVSNQLILTINSASGEATIENASGSASEVINGYGVFSATDTLDSAAWYSFVDDGQSGWEESANVNSKHVSELNLNGSRSVGPGASIDLGALYVPATQFGVTPDPVSFEYSLASGETRQGAVEISPTTLVLQVDPSSGQTQIVNPTGFTVQLNGYGVVSESGSLDAAAWSSFEDDGQSGWEASANANTKHVSELNLNGSREITMLEGDGPIALGNVFDHDKVGVMQDLVFEFSLEGGAVAGDYNADGAVNLADYTVWRDNLGAPEGTLPNDDDGGTIGVAQYETWKTNFGMAGGSGPGGVYTGVVEYVSLSGSLAAATAIPEPATGLLAGLASLGIVASGRKRS